MKNLALALVGLGLATSLNASASTADSLVGNYDGGDCKLSIADKGSQVEVTITSKVGGAITVSKSALDEAITQAAAKGQSSDLTVEVTSEDSLRLGFLDSGALNFVDVRSSYNVGGIYGARGADIVCGQLKRN